MQRIITSLPTQEFSVAPGNFDDQRKPVTMIVLHTEVGTRLGTRAVFATPPASPDKARSAHYGVNLDGTIDHYLEETLVAYHAANYIVNQESIGIEHEDNGDYNGPRSDALYTTSAKLVADICKYYSIPCTRDYIKKHSEVSLKATACPDALDVERIVREANALLHSPGDIEITATNGANIRTKPTITSSSQGVIPYGTKITLEGVVNGDTVGNSNIWLQLKGQLAYVWSGATNWTPPLVDKPTNVQTDNSTNPPTSTTPITVLTDDEKNSLIMMENARKKYGLPTKMATIIQLTTIADTVDDNKEKATGLLGSLAKLFGIQ